MKRAVRGFSLLEILAALALLALLLVGVYTGVRAAIRSVNVGSAAIGRLDQIRSAQQLLRREVMQSMAVPLAHNDQGDNLYFVGEPNQLRFVAPLPGYLGKLGPQLQQVSLESGANGTLQLVARFALLPPDGSAPQPLGEPEILLDGIRSGAISYRGLDEHGRPADWQSEWPDGRQLPLLVRIELQLDGRDAWPVLEVPLKVDPSANRGAMNLLRGLRIPTVTQ
ncbi:MAG: prepilin-type N-terminal cleavage/methylation domain-containing protein [Dyella sp.]